MNRPDLSTTPDAVLAYIEYLEESLLALQADEPHGRASAPPEPTEPPTPIHLISISQQGLAKRTARHFYGRQRRGGMGNFDLDTAEDDPPAHLILADEADDLLLITSFARAFRLPVAHLPQTEPRAKGQDLRELLEMHPKERLITALPHTSPAEYIFLLTPNGRLFARHRSYIRHGALLYDTSQNGRPHGRLLGNPSDDIFVATQQGLASRFSAKQVPTNGNACLGIRLEEGDTAVAVTAVSETGGVFLLGADGKGTVRLMAGFRANKSPGAGGKAALKTDKLVAAVATDEQSDLFIISRLGKLIRFSAADIPAKEGLVQGVNCMSLRADECTAVTG